jgi:hypothetical protein
MLVPYEDSVFRTTFYHPYRDTFATLVNKLARP